MAVEIIKAPEAMRAWSRARRAGRLRVGFVPTMGYLHDGHFSLMRRAKSECGVAVASIFVNQAQFGPHEDFERYPRDLERDLALLARAEVDALFLPEPQSIYPPGYSTYVSVENLSNVLCGAEGRRGQTHFRGVATVVAKLFNIVEPDVAYFGQKDAQQAVIIRTMARDLDTGVRVEVCETVREADGLAMSSRNKYLSAQERAGAPAIYRALCAAAGAAARGERSPAALVELTRRELAREPLFEIEYVEIVDTSSLSPLAGDRLSGEALLAVAGRIGGTRLIDNVIVAVKD